MKTISVGEDRYKVSLNYQLIGDDLLVVIKGGEKEHIGSVSLIQSENEGICQDIKLKGHKDHIISQEVAQILSKRFSKTVSVLCGIHIDDAKDYEIEILVQNTLNTLEGIEL